MKVIHLLLLVMFATGCSSVFYYPSKKQFYDPIKMKLKHEEVYFQSEDGTTLHGWYFPVEKPKGLIVQFHGNAENVSTHFLSLHWAMKRGYELFIFDYRGYGKSQGSPYPEGTIMDGKSALRWAEKRRQLKGIRRPLVVVGQSLGGAIALRSVYEIKNEIKFDLVVAESTFHSYKAVAQKAMAKSWLLWGFQWLPYLIISDKWAPSDKISQLSPIPVLVIHGDADPVVGSGLGKQVYSLANSPKEIWIVPGGKHLDTYWREEGKYQDKLIKLIECGSSCFH